jgi:3-dehydroquinate synthase II
LKELWIEILTNTSTSERAKILKLAAENSIIILENNTASPQRGNHKITVLENLNTHKIATLKLEGVRVAFRISIASKEDENTAAKAADHQIDYIILNCHDWRVIPLENLIAKAHGRSKLIAEASNAEEARVSLEALELGTDGVLLKTSDSKELEKTLEILKKQDDRIELTQAKVTAVRQISTGARVCVDTVDLMAQGEGILVGCQSAGFFLVEAEVHENPYVQARPFRVNAGAISMYVLVPKQKTRYLSELKAGDEVLVVNRKGDQSVTSVGRAKIEMRPLVLLEAEAKGKKINAILQNAETIHMVTPDGSKAVTDIKLGDAVVVHLPAMRGGRHFGEAVPEETVIER